LPDNPQIAGLRAEKYRRTRSVTVNLITPSEIFVLYLPSKRLRDRGMMGQQTGVQERLFYEFRLDDWIPTDHLLRKIDGILAI